MSQNNDQSPQNEVQGHRSGGWFRPPDPGRSGDRRIRSGTHAHSPVDRRVDLEDLTDRVDPSSDQEEIAGLVRTTLVDAARHVADA
ncbi:hypothetical protein [Promicromonospora sp. NFX87]|uniref:hypothetical protein n=1 Tax=Promicromonospora sp. NFX87 TaxID=3402691 RepID=UPI003AFB10FB